MFFRLMLSSSIGPNTSSSRCFHARPRINGLRGLEACFEVLCVVWKVAAGLEEVLINGAPHPIFVEQEVNTVGMVLLPVYKALPGPVAGLVGI